jgi:hypothetical protein
VDVERGLIQVKHGPGTNVEVLPLIMVNMLQKMNSKILMRDVAVTLENTHFNGDLDMAIENPSLCDPIMARQMDAIVSDSDIDITDDCDEGSQLVELNGDELEFGNTKLENLVLLEGPQQILQLILQGQVDDFMEKEIANADDYAD